MNKFDLRHLLKPRSFGRFAIMGSINTLFGMASFPTLYWIFGKTINVNILIVLGWAISTCFSFVSHKLFTFKSTGAYHHEGMKFLILSITILGINLLVMNIALSLTNINPIIIQFLTSVGFAIMMMILNYLGMNHLIFKSPAKE